jgi:hypothetical protein
MLFLTVFVSLQELLNSHQFNLMNIICESTTLQAMKTEQMKET